MASRVYEIVELKDGEYILQRVGCEDDPLVRIQFSKEARDFLSDARTSVAKSMIEAGLNEVEDLLEEELESRAEHTDTDAAYSDVESNTVH